MGASCRSPLLECLQGLIPQILEYGDILLHSVPLCQHAGFTDGREEFNMWLLAEFAYRNSSLILMLSDSANGFFQGAPGGVYSVPVPVHTHQFWRVRGINSDPSSMGMWVGAANLPRRSSKVSITSTAWRLLQE